MEPTEIKEKLHQFVDSGDDKLLKLMYAVAKEYSDDDLNYTLDAEEIAELERRRNNRINGSSKTYSWEIAKDIVTGKKSWNDL